MPDFRRFWFSGIVDSFAGQIGAIAMPLCAAMVLHATPSQMGVMAAASTLPFLLLSLPAGVWLDRRTKFPVLLVGELLYAVLLASIPLAYWLDCLSMRWLIVVSFLHGTVQVAAGTAQQVFLTYLVGREQLISAQAKFSGTYSVARLIGPGLGGLLVQWISAPLTILFNVLGFLFSALALLGIQARDPQPPPTDKHPLRDMQEGLVFIRDHRLLLGLAVVVGLWHILFYGYVALGVLFATRELHLSAGEFGATQALGGLGVLLSSFLMKPLNARLGAGKVILIGLGCTATGMAFNSLIPPDLPYLTLGLAALVTVVFDFGVFLFIIPYTTLRQRVTPDDYLSRMISTMRFLTIATGPLGAMAAGALGEVIGIRPALQCVALGLGLLCLGALMWTPLRTNRD